MNGSSRPQGASRPSSAYPDRRFWEGRRVLVTGHTGFKGSWLTLWLQQLGAHVAGVALPPSTEPNLFALAAVEAAGESHLQDIRDAGALAAIVRSCRPEIVFHLAAQPLVLASYSDPLNTFSTNVQGTCNLLDALRGLDSVRAVVAVTTDKVYRNQEQAYPYRESDALGGHDPYSASKAAAELVVACYRDAFLRKQGVAVASARAGNVIGGGDWSADRLIPDAVRAWSTSRTLEIRRPQAIRPWQHVLEPLAGYLRLGELLCSRPELADAYNFGPQTNEAASVREVIALAREAFGGGEVRWGDGSQGAHETSWLSLEIARARHRLGVEPRWTLRESVTRTMDWYRKQRDGVPAFELCLEDIHAFESAPAASGMERSSSALS